MFAADKRTDISPTVTEIVRTNLLRWRSGWNSPKILIESLATCLSKRRNFPRAKLTFQCSSDGQNVLLFPRPPDELHADGQSIERAAYRNHCGRIAQQVKKFGVTPGIEIMNSLAFNLPTSLAVSKRGDSSGRTQQDRILLHLREKLRAQYIALNPRVQQRYSSVNRLTSAANRGTLSGWD